MSEGDYLHLGVRAPRKRGYIVVAVVVPLVFAALLLWLHGAYREAEELRTAVEGSYQRRIAQITLLSRVSDAETAQRGYLLTGNPALRAPLDPAMRDVARQIAEIAHAPQDAQEATHIPHIARTIAAMQVELARTMLLARTGARDEALRSISTGPARRIMDRLAREIRREIRRETVKTDAREAAFLTQRANLRNLILLVVALTAVTLVVLLVLLWNVASRRHARILDAFEIAKGNATFFDDTVGALLILDPDGRIEVMNPAAVAMLGYFADKAEARDIATVIDIAPGIGSFHKRLGLVDGQLQRTQLTDRTVRDRTGREIPVDVAMGVLHRADGDRVVISLHDISERKRLDRAKDELISTVSHEIRTPLTSIIGALALLRTGVVGTMPTAAEQLVDIAENNSRRLIRLIDDMLDIDRIEAGKLRIDRAPVDLRDVLRQTRIGGEGLALKHGVRIACAMPDAPVIVSGDADRLLQVTSNLLSNAIRVSPRGAGVELSLTIDAADCALVTVADRGPGVPLGFRTRIFGRFERAARDDAATGTGLGLAISREIVTLHAGRLWFEDRPGGGTCFAFTLAQYDASERGPASRVLVCCDDDTLCERVVAILTEAGWRYDRVRSDAQARAALADPDYAAVLVEVDLAGSIGLDLAGTVCRHPGLWSRPVLLLLAIPTSHDPVALELIDLIDTPDEIRLGDAVRTALARSGSASPVALHLARGCDATAAVAVIASGLDADVRLVTAGDCDEARTLLAATAPDVALIDLATIGDLPVALDAQGVAIPTILYASKPSTGAVAPARAAVLLTPPGARVDFATTIRRALPAHGPA